MNELIRIEHELPYLNAETMTEIIENAKQIKELTERQDALKEALLNEMITKDVKKIQSSFVTITRIDATDKEKFDSKRFRAENPDLYDSYVSMSPTKAYVKLEVK